VRRKLNHALRREPDCRMLCCLGATGRPLKGWMAAQEQHTLNPVESGLDGQEHFDAQYDDIREAS
jgi:hypothetical protein